MAISRRNRSCCMGVASQFVREWDVMPVDVGESCVCRQILRVNENAGLINRDKVGGRTARQVANAA